jgi:hypothetical protein
VKPRDLRSNDKRVLALKKTYESAYPRGCLITKRGEDRPADRDAALTVDIAVLAKCLMAWHCQRPNIAYNENRLFDRHFEQLFKADYLPADIAGLNFWVRRIEDRWNAGDLPLNEALLASPSYSKFHMFFAIQLFFSAASNQIDKVPAPSATANFFDPHTLIGFAANCYNSALDAGMAEYHEKGKIFSPQNWLKAKDSLLKLSASVNMFIGFIPSMPGGPQMRQALVLSANSIRTPVGCLLTCRLTDVGLIAHGRYGLKSGRGMWEPARVRIWRAAVASRHRWHIAWVGEIEPSPKAPPSGGPARPPRRLPRRHRLFARVIVESAAGLATEPAGLDVLDEKRTRPVLGIGKPVVQRLHDAETGIEADEVGELKRAHRVMRAEPHRRIDALHRAHAFVERVDRLVDHRHQDPVDDERGKILSADRDLADLLREVV